MAFKLSVAKSNVIFYLGLLTLFFLLIEISFFIQCNQYYLADFSFVSNKLTMPWKIVPVIAYFILVQLSLHIIYWLFASYASFLVADFFAIDNKLISSLAIVIWFTGISTILLANATLYPNSVYSSFISSFIPYQIMAVITYILLSMSCIILAICCCQQSLVLFKKYHSLTITLVALAFVIAFGTKVFYTRQAPHHASHLPHPNIILIGVDSLRPDFLSFFGAEEKTAFFDNFLQQSVVFSEAVTPLARTFPSWVSILTGKYPKNTGIRYNLANTNALNMADTLASHLKTLGYQTIYATDETRFSNIDQQFGFDHVVSAPIGLNDFLLGNFSDFPFSNLLINTVFGKWLFPFSYGNRPAFITYNPDSFLNLVAPYLSNASEKPLFLTIHFCLTHYPYLWAGLSGHGNTPLERYAASILRVDQQIKRFYRLLNQNHLLDNALVVLLSDHGEALELAGDRITDEYRYQANKTLAKYNGPRFYPPSLDEELVNQSAGHGTDVLGLPQYHSLLAFRAYGFASYQPRTVSGIVPLIDIKPTILDLMYLPPQKADGKTLAPLIAGKMRQLTTKEHIFLESDYSPAAIRTVYPNAHDVLLEGIELFTINPLNTRLTVKKTMGEMIVKSKQFADIYGHWMLALYPQSNQTKMPILINLNTGLWTNDLSSRFAKQAPVTEMLQALLNFYHDEIGTVAMNIN
jgi:arylsulfatase A-like enzyme